MVQSLSNGRSCWPAGETPSLQPKRQTRETEETHEGHHLYIITTLEVKQTLSVRSINKDYLFTTFSSGFLQGFLHDSFAPVFSL